VNGTKIELYNSASSSNALVLNGLNNYNKEVQFQEASGYMGALGWDGTSDYIYIYQGGSALIAQSNKIGIGGVVPTQSLDVNGNARFRSVGTGTYYSALNITSTGVLTTSTSDIRLKENIKPLKDGLKKVLNLKGVNFTWKSDSTHAQRIGFIAQDVEEVLPELVFTNHTDGYKGINYAEITAVLTEAIKEQQAQITTLEAENKSLKDDIDALKARLARLEELLGEAAKK
jgi:hypothetical protein